MKFLKYVFIVLFVFFSVFSTYSASMTVLVTQHDAAEDIVRVTTRVIENTLMDYFFDVGYIVSNEPIISKWSDSDEYRAAYSRALEGGFDYFLALTIHYRTEASTNPEGILLDDVASAEWKVITYKDNKTVCQGNLLPSQNTKAVTLSEQSRGVKDFSYQIGKEITAKLKKYK